MIAVIRFKPGVALVPTPSLARILWALQSVADEWAQDITVSCGAERHDQTDPHTTGEAVDISVAGMDAFEIVTLYRNLSRALGAAFYCQIEAPTASGIKDQPLLDLLVVNARASAMHLHVQRKKNTVYPPQSNGVH